MEYEREHAPKKKIENANKLGESRNCKLGKEEEMKNEKLERRRKSRMMKGKMMQG